MSASEIPASARQTRTAQTPVAPMFATAEMDSFLARIIEPVKVRLACWNDHIPSDSA